MVDKLDVVKNIAKALATIISICIGVSICALYPMLLFKNYYFLLIRVLFYCFILVFFIVFCVMILDKCLKDDFVISFFDRLHQGLSIVFGFVCFWMLVWLIIYFVMFL